MTHSSMRGITVCLPILLLATACASSGDATGNGAEPIAASISSPLPEHGMSEGLNWWVAEVESRTDGKIDFELYFNSSLLSASGGMDGMNDGRVEGAFIANSYRPEELPLLEIVGIPFETDDSYAMARAYADVYESNTDFQSQLNDAGFHMEFIVPYTSTTFATRQPIEAPEDLTGKRYRAAGIVGNVVDDLGAEAIYLDTGDVYEAVERGVIDGVAGWPIDLMSDYGVGEAAPYITDVGYGHYAMGAIAFDLEWYEALPADVRATMTEVTQELHEKKIGEFLNALEAKACDDLVAIDSTVSVWSEAQTDALKNELTVDFVQLWADSVTTNSSLTQEQAMTFYDDFHAAYDLHTKSSPYTKPVLSCG